MSMVACLASLWGGECKGSFEYNSGMKMVMIFAHKIDLRHIFRVSYRSLDGVVVV